MPDCRHFTKADAGTRTPDPFITSEVLYQLSYVGAIALKQSDEPAEFYRRPWKPRACG